MLADLSGADDEQRHVVVTNSMITDERPIPVPPGSVAVRQTVLTGAVNSSGDPAFFAAGSGLAVNLSATATAVALAFAAGFDGRGAVDYVSRITADSAGFIAGLSASNTSYLSADYVSPAAVTWGKYLVPRQEGKAFDQTQNSLLHFDSATVTCDFGNTYTAQGGAATSVTKPAYGARSLDLSGGAGTTANAKCFSTPITSLGADSWEVSSVVWFDTVPNAGVQHNFMCATSNAGLGMVVGWKETGGNRRACFNISSDGSTFDVAAAVGSALGTTNLATGKWYRFRLAFDALGGTYRLYVADGASGASPVWGAEVKECDVSSSSRVCAVGQLTWGCYYNGTYNSGMSGFMDEARLIRCATSTSAVTPTGFPQTIADYPVNWFDLSAMTMKEATTASAIAGTNPTFTAKTGCFSARRTPAVWQ
jgi:hypothetical protein